MSRSKLNLSLFYDNLARVESSMGKLPTWNIGTRNSAGQISDFAEGWEHRRDGELRKSIVKTKINKRGENWRKDECNSTVTQFKQQLRLTRGNCDRFTSGNYDRVTSGNGKQMELYPGRGTCKVDRDTRESDKNSRGIERDFTEVYDY